MEQATQQWIQNSLDPEHLVSLKEVKGAEHNQVYKVTTDKGVYFLKHGPNLKVEQDRLSWLQGKLPVPQVIAWRQTDDQQEELLMTAVEGQDLATLAKHVPDHALINYLIEALDAIRAVDISDYPFDKPQPGQTFVHGDACLPNIIFNDGKLAGIIDVDKAGIGDPKIDCAAAIWSLAYNCGPEICLSFLQQYSNPHATAEDVIALIKQYEPTWSGY